MDVGEQRQSLGGDLSTDYERAPTAPTRSRRRTALAFVGVLGLALAVVLAFLAGRESGSPGQGVLDRLTGERVRVEIEIPEDGATIREGASWAARAESPDGIERVEFFVDDKLTFTEEEPPYQPEDPGLDVGALEPGEHELKVVAHSNDGDQAEDSVEVTVEDRAAPAPAPGPRGELLFNGDFETGDLSQWDEDRTQSVGPDRLRVVTSPRRQGRYALRVEVRQGDDPIGSGNPRAELLRKDQRDPEGSVRYYAWSTLVSSEYPIDETWQVFLQFKHEGEGSPPVQFGADGGDLGFSVSGGEVQGWRGPLVPERWYDFVLGAKWSPDASEGWLELWVNGQLVLPRRNFPTMYRDDDGRTLPNYVKLGYYRSDDIERPGVIYHDAFRVGRTRESVARP